MIHLAWKYSQNTPERVFEFGDEYASNRLGLSQWYLAKITH